MVRGNKTGVVVLNYKDAETTEKLCQRIVGYDAIDHIVVVDNLSPDDSYEKLRMLASAKVDVIRSDRNGGYSYGNNVGAFYLTDQYQVDILYIANPDVEFDEEFVRRTTELIASGRAQAVSGVMMMPDGKSGVDGTRINRYIDDLLDCTLLLKHVFRRKQSAVTCGKGVIDTEFLYGSLFGIDAGVFREIGGFDELVFLYCEERILGRRLQEKGYRLAIDTGVSYVHRHSVSVNRSISKIRQVKTLYQSRQYYYQEYETIGKFRKWLLKVGMGYGILVRRALYLVADRAG